ncbi:hypothetical protein NFJ02_38g97110 [Pycnococcus provasolii]
MHRPETSRRERVDFET